MSNWIDGTQKFIKHHGGYEIWSVHVKWPTAKFGYVVRYYIRGTSYTYRGPGIVVQVINTISQLVH